MNLGEKLGVSSTLGICLQMILVKYLHLDLNVLENHL